MNNFTAIIMDTLINQTRREITGGSIGARRVLEDNMIDIEEILNPPPIPLNLSIAGLCEEITTDEQHDVITTEETGEEVCPICLNKIIEESCNKKNGARTKIKCDKCQNFSCSKCLFKYFKREEVETQLEFFPKCMSCGEEFTLIVCNKYNLIRQAIGEISLTRITERAINRERILLQTSMYSANIHRTRKLAIEVLNQLYCDFSLCKSNIVISNINGQTPNIGPNIRSNISSLYTEFLEVLKTPNSINKPVNIYGFMLQCMTYIFKYSPETNKGKSYLHMLAYVVGVVSKNHDYIDSDLSSVLENITTDLNYLNQEFISRNTESVDERIRHINSGLTLLLDNIKLLQKVFMDLHEIIWFSPNGKEIIDILYRLLDENKLNLKNYSNISIKNIKPSRESESLAGNDVRSGGGGFAQCKCVKTGCRGFMFRAKRPPPIDEILECRVCKAEICAKCREPCFTLFDGGGLPHTCKKESIESVKMLEQISRPCPKCAIPIVKIDGCRHMFCTICKQPYDWETLETHISNTNPEYYTWVDRERRRNFSGETIQNADRFRQLFSPESIGDDGMSLTQRLELLSEKYMYDGYRTLSYIIQVLNLIETNIITNLIKLIPSPSEFEKMRISYILRTLTEIEWVEKIEWAETLSVYIQYVITELDKFITGTLETVKSIYLESNNQTRTANELRALKCALENANQCNIEFFNIFSIFGLRLNSAKTKTLFPSAYSFLHRLNSITLEDNPNLSLFSNNDIISVFSNFGLRRESEIQKINKVLKINSIKTILDFVKHAYHVKKSQSMTSGVN